MKIPFLHRKERLPVMPSSLPPGTVIAFAGQLNTTGTSVTAETIVGTYGWLLCNGATYNISDYPVLSSVLGTLYNTGSESNDEFSLPDYRGYFLRMTDMGAGRDPDSGSRKLPNGQTSAGVGSVQSFALQQHQHTYNGAETAAAEEGGGAAAIALQGYTGNATAQSGPAVQTSTETRPLNTYVYYLIKYV
ncbi:phage tail protein [Chitinophaga tropicalis]|uniref:Tail fiber protein n=1 Tax=Chitinophaga tropicalis TaxID=2683588 RepID=A0A7K1U3R0_9BACT|nr:tail fiber protein [Chitinophaga tropicalis]MVT09004.1 tail fiber protein [Chitinophaga tropicalis]